MTQGENKTTSWPDPNKPGVPLNPERDGRHWLFDAKSNVSFPEFWVAGMGAWAVGDAWTARMVAEMGLHYQSPVLMPAEADALRAENARLREALEGMLSGSKYNEEEGWWVLIRTPTSKELSAARAALDPDGQKERRAKALSELAEMDADLLDIDPEVKL
jgi:hypothetical protein